MKCKRCGKDFSIEDCVKIPAEGKDYVWYYCTYCNQGHAVGGTSSSDNVNHPNHYNAGSIECIEAMIAAYGVDEVKTFCKINAFKYLWRASHKNGREDMEKAYWYIDKWLELD